jgi:hypothetical protein
MRNDVFRLRTIKLRNRRVTIGRGISIGDIFIQFKRLVEFVEAPINSYSETIIEGKLVTTKVIISKAAAVSLYHLLKNELTLSDMESFDSLYTGKRNNKIIK